MRYTFLILATLMTFVAARSSKLKQATRAQIAERMASPVNRRQSLPSAGVYPTCPGSLPRGTANTVTTSVVIGHGIFGNTIGFLRVTSNQQCADRCLANTRCVSATRFTSGLFCELQSSIAEYYEDVDSNAIVPGQSCASAQAIIGDPISCCEYLTTARG